MFSGAFFIALKQDFFVFLGGRFVFYERTIRLKSQEHFVLRIIHVLSRIVWKYKVVFGSVILQ